MSADMKSRSEEFKYSILSGWFVSAGGVPACIQFFGGQVFLSEGEAGNDTKCEDSDQKKMRRESQDAHRFCRLIS